MHLSGIATFAAEAVNEIVIAILKGFVANGRQPLFQL
jgi:hypothetical protein